MGLFNQKIRFTAQAIAVLLGIAGLGLGLYSQLVPNSSSLLTTKTKRFSLLATSVDETCNFKDLFGDSECQRVILELYYVIANCLGNLILILAAFSRCFSYLQVFTRIPKKRLAFITNVLAAVILFSGGILYIISTQQIHELYDVILALQKLDYQSFLSNAKAGAGIIAILQAVVCGIAAYFGSGKEESKTAESKKID